MELCSKDTNTYCRDVEEISYHHSYAADHFILEYLCLNPQDVTWQNMRESYLP